jgi:hypothetical protein
MSAYTQFGYSYPSASQVFFISYFLYFYLCMILYNGLI